MTSSFVVGGNDAIKSSYPLIRKATVIDLQKLVDLEQACFSSDRISRRSYQLFLKHSSAEVIVLEVHQKIIGSATVLFRKNSKKARLYSIAVHTDYRLQGLAVMLYAHIECVVKARQCQLLSLEVRPDNASAIRFYERHGYKHIGRILGFYEDGMDALRMQKKLM